MSKIYIASDHAGFVLKNALISHIRTLGYDIEDMGAAALNPEDDYPDFMTPLAKRVAAEPDARGIIIGGSGQGEAMCANRVSGIRAAVFYVIAASSAIMPNLSNDSASAEALANSAQIAEPTAFVNSTRTKDVYEIVRRTRQHNNANILSIGARFVTQDEAFEAVRIFLETEFSGAERHQRRLAKF